MKYITFLLTLLSPSLQAATFEDLLEPLYGHSEQWICKAASEHSCGTGGCSKTSSGLYILLNLNRHSDSAGYHRCDAEGCDKYSLRMKQSGAYTTITLSDHPGIFLKVMNDGSGFAEVASLGTAIYMKFGSCEAIDPQ